MSLTCHHLHCGNASMWSERSSTLSDCGRWPYRLRPPLLLLLLRPPRPPRPPLLPISAPAPRPDAAAARSIGCCPAVRPPEMAALLGFESCSRVSRGCASPGSSASMSSSSACTWRSRVPSIGNLAPHTGHAPQGGEVLSIPSRGLLSDAGPAGGLWAPGSLTGGRRLPRGFLAAASLTSVGSLDPVTAPPAALGLSAAGFTGSAASVPVAGCERTVLPVGAPICVTGCRRSGRQWRLGAGSLPRACWRAVPLRLWSAAAPPAAAAEASGAVTLTYAEERRPNKTERGCAPVLLAVVTGAPVLRGGSSVWHRRHARR